MSQPWFPFYVGDYVRDTARLSTEAHGAYLLLMLDYWPNGAPPDDDATLATITKLPVRSWLAMRSKLEPFFTISAGRWTHKRIEVELEKSERISNAGRKAGIASAERRRNESATIIQRSLPDRSNDDATKCQPSQPQSQPQQKDHSRSIEADRPVRAPSRFEEFWKAYPRREGPNPRKPAEAKFNALVKSGLDPEFLIAEVTKFASAEAGRGNVGSRFVPQAVTWLSQQRWADHAAIAFLESDAAAKVMPIEAAVAMFVKLGIWSRYAPGNAPGEPGCQASAELLAAHGLGIDGRKLSEVA